MVFADDLHHLGRTATLTELTTDTFKASFEEAADTLSHVQCTTTQTLSAVDSTTTPLLSSIYCCTQEATCQLEFLTRRIHHALGQKLQRHHHVALKVVYRSFNVSPLVDRTTIGIAVTTGLHHRSKDYWVFTTRDVNVAWFVKRIANRLTKVLKSLIHTLDQIARLLSQGFSTEPSIANAFKEAFLPRFTMVGPQPFGKVFCRQNDFSSLVFNRTFDILPLLDQIAGLGIIVLLSIQLRLGQFSCKLTSDIKLLDVVELTGGFIPGSLQSFFGFVSGPHRRLDGVHHTCLSHTECVAHTLNQSIVFESFKAVFQPTESFEPFEPTTHAILQGLEHSRSVY